MKINDVFDQLGSDVLTEETKTILVEAFNEAVSAATHERVTIEVQDALTKLDEEHANQLATLLEAVDKDHTQKLQAVLAKIDEDHTEKLQYYIKKSDALLKEDAGEFKNQLVKQLSNYLDLYLEDAIPKGEIAEAVANKQAQKALNEIKQIVAIDEEYINDTIREAVMDGKQTIDTLKKELNEAVKQNIRLNQSVKTTQSALLIEQATRGFAKDKKSYVTRVLKGNDPEYITENFEYVVKMFDKDDSDRTQILAEDAKTKSRVINENYDTPKSQSRGKELINENTDQSSEGAVGGYLESLTWQDSRRGLK